MSAFRSVAPQSAALVSTDGAASITDFLDSGYVAAVALAAQTVSLQTCYAQWRVQTHPATRYSRVDAAERRALAGTDEELDEFVRTGYAIALELDRRRIADEKLRADLIKQADREFVIAPRDNDPGAQVRSWAGRAVAPVHKIGGHFEGQTGENGNEPGIDGFWNGAPASLKEIQPGSTNPVNALKSASDKARRSILRIGYGDKGAVLFIRAPVISAAEARNIDHLICMAGGRAFSKISIRTKDGWVHYGG